ncbi:hypothetical protein RYA05_04035 [Pseudomonas syringae pv. actinidiae]|nr:hypothetical protein [Pseudomonas syringae pv. actinidiae]
MSDDTRNIIVVSGQSSCRCDDECDCPHTDSLTFEVNGIGGHGGGELVQKSPGGDPVFDCNFMGFKFEATSDVDARNQIKTHMSAFKNIVFW